MGTLTHKAARAAYGTAIDAVLKHVKKDREKGLLELVDLTEKYMGDNFQKENYEAARKMIQDPDNKWVKYVNHMIDELDPYVIRQTALNLGYEAAFYGTKTIREMRKKYDCNIPWLILMDPTSACNLHCTGCWAAEYGNRLNLTYNDLDSVITQGKELGIYFYMYTGGEPLVRKDDIIKLCKKHNDCAFHAFTNGTLVDEALCKQMQEVGNLIQARSEVERVEFESAEQAWENFKDKYFQGSDAAEGFKDDNPLVNSSNYHVYLNQIEKQTELVNYIQGLEHVRDVEQSEQAANTLGSFNKLVSYASIVIIALLLIISIFLISNTVTMGITVRREEIAIMKYIGAKDGFVRAPFVFEGLLIGAIGAVIPLGILYLVYEKAIHYILERFHLLQNIINFLPVTQVYRTLLPVGILLGVGIGFVGSFFTIRKHLKV